MNVITEITALEDFDAWNGGKARKDDAIYSGVAEKVWKYIEEVTNGQATEGEINELLWFDETINDMIYNDLDDENEDI